MSPQARDRSFDEMASRLASGDISRLEALKWLGAALLGGALAFTPKVAGAAAPCPEGQRKCGSDIFGDPECYDPTTEFCCHSHGRTARCLRATQQCCFLEGGPICQNIGAFCSTRVRFG
jgi:hypothetical protein